MLNDWSHKPQAIVIILPGQYQYCPLCHKARGMHDFILATKIPIWIIIKDLSSDSQEKILNIMT